MCVVNRVAYLFGVMPNHANFFSERHWQVVTSSLPETLDFSGKFESSTLPEEETLYRNLVKVVIPKMRSVVEDEVEFFKIIFCGCGCVWGYALCISASVYNSKIYLHFVIY